MTMQELFEFVISDAITDVDGYLSQMQVKISQRSGEMDAKAQIDEGVFMGAPVIRRLDELIDHEKEHQKLKSKAVGFHGAIAQMTVQEETTTTSKTSKPSAKPVHAPTQVATDRNGAAPSLFAGLLLPQVEDQANVTNSAAQPGYVSGEDEDDEEEEEEDGEEESEEEAPSTSVSRSSSKHPVHSAKPSAKAVHAPEKSATDRGVGASTLFAGLLLPQLEDQLTLTNSVPEPGYISGEDNAEDDDDSELEANANHTEAGGRRVMTHVQRKAKRGEAQEESSEEESDGEDHSDAGSSRSRSGSDDDEDTAGSDEQWVDRPKMSEEEQRAARKAAKKDAKATQAEKRKTKVKKKDKKAKINKGKH
jgi:hypothetical protein